MIKSAIAIIIFIGFLLVIMWELNDERKRYK